MTKQFAAPVRLAALASLVVVASCSSGPPPNAQLGAGRAAINDAERAGAAERAPVELNTARTKLEQAQDAARRGRNEEAARLAREAEIDAQLAGARAQSASTQAALDQVRRGIGTLQNELQSTTPRSVAPLGTAPTTTPR